MRESEMGHNEDDWLIQEFTRQVVEEAAKGKGKELLRVLQEGLAQTARAETGILENRIDAIRQQITSSVETIPAKTTEKLTNLFQKNPSVADMDKIRQALAGLNDKIDNLSRAFQKQEKSAQLLEDGIKAIADVLEVRGLAVQIPRALVTPPGGERKLTKSAWAKLHLWQKVVLIVVPVILGVLGWEYYSLPPDLRRSVDISPPKRTSPAQDPKPIPPTSPEKKPDNPAPTPRVLHRLLELRVDSVKDCSEQQDVVMRNCLQKLGVSLEVETIDELLDKVDVSPKKAEASAVILQAVAKTLGKDDRFMIDGRWGKSSRAALDKIPCVVEFYHYSAIPKTSPPENLLKDILHACATDLTNSAP